MEKPWYKRFGAWIVAAFGVLVALFFAQKRRADEAEGQLITAETKEKDAALKEQEKVAEANASAERANLKALEKLKESGVSDLTPEEVKDHWKDK